MHRFEPHTSIMEGFGAFETHVLLSIAHMMRTFVSKA